MRTSRVAAWPVRRIRHTDPPPGSRARRLPAAALLAATTLTGCGSVPAPVGTAADVTRNISPEDAHLLLRAEQILTGECMGQLGFRVVPGPGDRVDGDRNFPYVINDLRWARQHGYGSDIQTRKQELGAHDPNRHYFASLSPDRQDAALDALNGKRPEGLAATLPTGGTVQHSDQGCTSQAQRMLYGDLRTWYRVDRVTGNLAPARHRMVQDDPAYRRPLDRWAACMRAAGFPYASPGAAREEFLSAEPPGPRDLEIRAAVAEASCADSSGLARTASELDARFGDELQRRYAHELATKLALQRAALPMAHTITAS